MLYSSYRTWIGSFMDYLSLTKYKMMRIEWAMNEYVQSNDATKLQTAMVMSQDLNEITGSAAVLGRRYIPSMVNWRRFSGQMWDNLVVSLQEVDDRQRPIGHPTADDVRYLQRLSSELHQMQVVIQRVQGRDNQAVFAVADAKELADRAERFLELIHTWGDQGIFPEEIPQQSYNAAEVEAIARRDLKLAPEEWSVTRVNTNGLVRLRDNLIRANVTFTNQQDANRTVFVDVDMVTKRVWHISKSPRTYGYPPLIEGEQLKSWAEAATQDLPGPKAVVDLRSNAQGGDPVAEVAPTIDGIPVLSQRLILAFNAFTGELLERTYPQWAPLTPIQPSISQEQAQQVVSSRTKNSPQEIQVLGMAYIQSAFSNQTALVYRLQTPSGEWWMINAMSGRIEQQKGIVM